MAMSLSRPDPSSPAAVADATFGTSRRGYDQSEVREFLRNVAAEFARVKERSRFLEAELKAAEANGIDPATIDEDAMIRLLGEESVRILSTARDSAAEIREKAEQAASRLLAEAGDEAARVREEADIEAARRRADAAADAEAELAMAKQQGREMVNEARAYRERVLSELARRRELAREQIEQLVHGRDRLMQAFERARLVAVDVVAELQPLGEPDEYVNLSPTTGPLPVMIANSPRPEEAAEEVVEAAAAAEAEEAEVEEAAAQGEEAEEVAAQEEEAEEVVEAEESDAAEEVVEAEEASEETAGETAEEAVEAEAADTSDHVVVDLFARLRAETDDEADAVTEAETDGDVEEQPERSDQPTVFERRDEVVTPLIVASGKKLKRALADEQNEVLDALRTGDAVRELDELLPWASEHMRRYTEAVVDEMTAAVNAGGAESRGHQRKMRKALIAESIEHANALIEQTLVTPLRDRLARCVAEGDGDNSVVTKKVRAVYREWKTQHIDDQLDDIVRTAFGWGMLAGYPDGTSVLWTVDDRHGACADCEDNALAGPTVAGSEFPTGHIAAPAHAGCRCLLVQDPG